MKAALCRQYGGPDTVQIQEIPAPEPTRNEVLIKVIASTVNSGDVFIRKGSFMVRLVFGLTKPRKPILGVTLSGEIVRVGKDVTMFKPGDQVFGATGMSSACAEYVCLSEKGVLALKPDCLSHIEAAAIPFGGNTALHFARKAKIVPGDTVLIYGASGAVGTSAIQVAKAFGASVTAVCSTANLELVRSLGADHVIDYTKEMVLKDGDSYRIIWDTVGKLDETLIRKYITEDGLIIANANGFISTRKKLCGLVKESAEGIVFLRELASEGHFKPVVDRVYPFAEIAAAHAYVDTGHKKGNVVVSIVS